jgi:ketosteroid isomerase-like protein
VSREREETIRRGYQAMTRLDVDSWLETVHTEVELHDLPDMPDTAVYRGHPGMRHWIEEMMKVVETWDWTPEEFVDEGSAVIVRVRVSAEGRGSGVTLEQVVFHVFDFRDRKIVRVRAFLDRDEALEAVGLRE